MVSIQPELWIERAREALGFYEAAFGARVVHCIGEGDDIVAQLAVGDAYFWISAVSPSLGRLNPIDLAGGTGRTLLVVDDPDSVVESAAAAGAAVKSAVEDEHGWRIGRIIDPFGHEWEIGKPIDRWPPI